MQIWEIACTSNALSDLPDVGGFLADVVSTSLSNGLFDGSFIVEWCLIVSNRHLYGGWWCQVLIFCFGPVTFLPLPLFSILSLVKLVILPLEHQTIQRDFHILWSKDNTSFHTNRSFSRVVDLVGLALLIESHPSSLLYPPIELRTIVIMYPHLASPWM